MWRRNRDERRCCYLVLFRSIEENGILKRPDIQLAFWLSEMVGGPVSPGTGRCQNRALEADHPQAPLG